MSISKWFEQPDYKDDIWSALNDLIKSCKVLPFKDS